MNTYQTLVITLIAAVFSLRLHAEQPPDYGSEAFARTWYDGKAELASYDLVYPRYGELREGTAVAITVTEDFDWKHRVKHDGPIDDTGDNVKFKVVKLNLIEDFPTGLYDYNLMHSVFVAAEPVKHLKAGSVVKTTFSAQEWCGQAWQQAVWGTDPRFNKPVVKVQTRSYFEGEADTDETMQAPPGGFAEDALYLWARKLAGPQPAAGETVAVPVLRSSAVSRLRHVPVAYDSAELSIDAELSRVEHEQLGEIRAYVARAVVSRSSTESAFTGRAVPAQQDTYEFTVEAEPPHRVLRMRRSDGLDLRLIRAERLPYWQLNAPGALEKLGELGLTPRPARTP